MTALRWGVGKWGRNTWGHRTYPPGAVWGADWRWWYQDTATTYASWDITDLVVEARWTTDGHTMGDGTFRGDIQPGRLELRLMDPGARSSFIGLLGTIWARYEPTEATWCWFVYDVTSLLAPPGDPLRWDVVVTADTWPDRLKSGSYNSARPAETVAARLGAIVSRLNSDVGLRLPAVAGQIAADAHTVPAVVLAGTPTPFYPAFLDQVRQAAANGVAWLEARSVPTPWTPGSLVLHYDLWNTATGRLVSEAQVNSATPWTYGMEHIKTHVTWAGVNAAGVATTIDQTGGTYGAYGVQSLGPMRILGDVAAGGAQLAAVQATGSSILADHANPAQRVDLIVVTSGDRTHPNGSPSVLWDPTANVWNPTEPLQWYRFGPTNPLETYRVTQTEHRLTARVWESTHHLEMFTQPTPLP